MSKSFEGDVVHGFELSLSRDETRQEYLHRLRLMMVDIRFRMSRIKTLYDLQQAITENTHENVIDAAEVFYTSEQKFLGRIIDEAIAGASTEYRELQKKFVAIARIYKLASRQS